jgi:phage tail-like protein
VAPTAGLQRVPAGTALANGPRAALAAPERVWDIGVSSYLAYLPAPYQRDSFMARFLFIFESIIGPIERTIDEVARYFDPQLTPAALLPWLASWVGVELDDRWPEAKQRALVGAAARLYRARGTRGGLREHLEIYTGHRPLIVENFDGMRLGQDAALGVNTRLGTARPHTVAVTAFVDRRNELDEQVVRRIVETEIPVHAGYTLEILEVRETRGV